jgi:hypothetical protein
MNIQKQIEKAEADLDYSEALEPIDVANLIKQRGKYKAHAERLAEALNAIAKGLDTVEQMARHIAKDNGIANSIHEKSDWAREALAQYERSKIK